jgi:hypothetical protein
MIQTTAKVVTLKQPFEIRPCTKKQLAAMYGVSLYVFNGWLRDISVQLGKKVGRSFSCAQVQTIVERFGVPGQQVNEKAA